jgi:hypothetical protein
LPISYHAAPFLLAIGQRGEASFGSEAAVEVAEVLEARHQRKERKRYGKTSIVEIAWTARQREALVNLGKWKLAIELYFRRRGRDPRGLSGLPLRGRYAH